MPKGWPDFTLPISIEAVAIATLPVDIKAQTVGNIGIDIAAQSVGDINVNLAASAVTLNMNLKVAEATVATRKSLIADADFETGAGWVLLGGALISSENYYTGWYSLKFPGGTASPPSADQAGIPPIDTNKLSGFVISQKCDDVTEYAQVWVYYSDGSTDVTHLIPSGTGWETFNVTYAADKFIVEIWIWRPQGSFDIYIDGCYPILKIDEYMGTAAGVNLNVDIKAATAKVAVSINVADVVGNLPIDIKAQSVGNINVNIAAQAANVNVNLAASAATVNVNITGSVQLNVNVTNATITVTGTVSISGTVTVQGTVSISGTVTVAGTVSISGTVTVTGSVSVSGAVSISGTVTITGTVNVSGTVTITGAVTVSSGTVNVQTSGGINLIIDKLTQAAYLERRSTLTNDNGVTSPGAPPAYSTGITHKGKFFPRGCRGFLLDLSVYCMRTSTGTLTLSVAPQPGMGAVYSASMTPANFWDWRSGTIGKFWNYDSMFIWVSACSVDVSYGYEAATPYDGYTSPDSGVTWTSEDRRYFMRAGLTAETIGDVPVSGIINTIEIPNATTVKALEVTSIPAGSETTIVTQIGQGTNLEVFVRVPYTTGYNWTLYIYVDGVQQEYFRFTSGVFDDPNAYPHFGYSQISNTYLCFRIHVRYTFKRSLAISLFQNSGGNQTVSGLLLTNLLG